MSSGSANYDLSENSPPNWLGCPPIGELVGSIFLPFKTPVQDANLPPNLRFGPEQFLAETKRRRIDVGLVINLCNTTKYYDIREFENHEGLEYAQIPCRGHAEAPQAKEQGEFVKTCNAFLAKHPDKIIAVHCTHGFNRTGFMICYFLCSERDWAIEATVSQFADKRKPGIYKQDYINQLFEIFGDCDDPVPQAPLKPNWDSEEFLQSEDLLQANSSINQKEFFEGITDVDLVRDDSLKHRIYKDCCTICNYNVGGSGISFPGAHPVSMDVKNIQLLKERRYRVSWKADGTRYMMYIENEENIFFLTRAHHLWRVKGLKFPKIEDLNSHLTQTLLDGEMVTDVVAGKKIPTYLVYDVISLNGNVVGTQDFDRRCGLIHCVIIKARQKAKELNIIASDGEPFKVRAKPFSYIYQTKKTLDLQVTHEKDGLIFQPLDAPYTGGTCHEILKWKPPHLNSIDFRLVIREERQNGCIPETYAFLHVSNRPTAILKFKLAKDQQSYHDYNNKIVEMTWKKSETTEGGKWIVIRERTDKLAANSYETAYSTWNSIKYPVTESFLLDFIANIQPEKRAKVS